MGKFNTDNDLRLAVTGENDEFLVDERCCTCINIILKNDGQIMTSFLGAHNPEIVKTLEKAQKAYFKELKKTLKKKYAEKEVCGCSPECTCGDDCHCTSDNHCGCGGHCHEEKQECNCGCEEHTKKGKHEHEDCCCGHSHDNSSCDCGCNSENKSGEKKQTTSTTKKSSNKKSTSSSKAKNSIGSKQQAKTTKK